jgi:hypothetical protein
MPVLTGRYEERQGHAPGERAAYALACQAADQTLPPKRTELLSLTELRTRWRHSAIRAFGACTVYRLAERARAAAAAVWARVRPVVDIALAAVDVVVYVMRGAFARHHLLAEARRHLSYVLRGRPHQPGPGRADRADGRRRLHPPGEPADGDRRPARAVSARHRGAGRAAPADPQADRFAVRAGPPRRRRSGRPGPRGAASGAPGLPPSPVRRRRARRLEVAPAAVPHRPEGRPPPGAGDRR